MDISGTGVFIAPISNLPNINYWIGTNSITAYGGAPWASVNVDTDLLPGSVVLTAIPEPSVIVLGAFGMLSLVVFRRLGRR